MAEEAMSETIQSIVESLTSQVLENRQTGQKKRLTLPGWEDAFGQWGIAPFHDDVGEVFEGEPAARMPISQDLYYATIWVMEHGCANPCSPWQIAPIKLSDRLYENWERRWKGP